MNLPTTFLACGCLVTLTTAVLAQQGSVAEPRTEKLIEEFIRAQLKEDPSEAGAIASCIDLDGDGETEVLVYLAGRDWCGSGGCHLLVLARTETSLRMVSMVPITRPPIRVLTRKSHGWRSLSVLVVGGGILQGYSAELRFDGTKYPENPSMPPARRLGGRPVSGVTVISRDPGPSYKERALVGCP
jgi:hypothetical protein